MEPTTASPATDESIRLAREAYRKYHAVCFWHMDPDLTINAEQLRMIAEGLRRHGDREAFRLAQEICR